MPVTLTKTEYVRLNSKQKEAFNFAKVSAVLADYGFMTIRLSDDWQNADFIAQHVSDGTFLKVQLKGRLTFNAQYQGKDLYIAFPSDGDWYLYGHDELLAKVLAETNVANTDSWITHRAYSFPALSSQLRAVLKPYKIHGGTEGLE